MRVQSLVMQFCVLGSVEVAAHGRRVAVSGRRRTILAVLLAADGRVVTTDHLVDAVWGDTPPPSARKSLQSHVSRLRGQLQAVAPDEPDAVVTEEDGYRVDLDTHDFDAHAFLDLVDRARDRAAARGDVAELLSEAESLWRGPAFGELADHPAVRAAASGLECVRPPPRSGSTACSPRGVPRRRWRGCRRSWIVIRTTSGSSSS